MGKGSEKYFKNKSKTYDFDNNKPYWRLCDLILENLFINELDKLDKHFKFLDAGAGTGEWSLKILKKYPESTGVCIDSSTEMLEHCKKKLSNFYDRININSSNLEHMYYDKCTFDLSFNFYVLPFTDNEPIILKELSRVTKHGGYIISVVENFYNGLALNILTGDINRINNVCINKHERIGEKIPKIRFHTITDIKKLYKNSGIKIIDIKGFPIVSSTGIREKLTNNKYNINEVLQDENIFNRVLNIEKQLVNDKDLINRGKYLYVVGIKE